MRGWVCWVVPVKRAGCSSVEVNPRWWRNFINLTYCSWWHRDTEDTKRNRLVMTGTRRERERRVSVLKQPTALKHFYEATTLQWIRSYLTGRGFPVSASSSSQLVQPDGCDPSWPHLKLWHLVMDEDTITNFLLSFNLYVMLKLKTATQYSQLLYFLWRLSEVDEMISLITSVQDQHSAYNYQQRKDPQHIFLFFYTKLPVICYKYTTINFFFNLVMTVSFWCVDLTWK